METSKPPPLAEQLLAERAWLERLSLRLTSADASEDLSQETLRRAIQSPPHAEGGPGLRAWLGGVARRLAAERWRSESHRRGREQAAAVPERLPDASVELERADLARFIAAAVMDLPEPLRTTVVLRYYEGLPYPAIARRTSISEAAARKRGSRAIAALRSQLDERAGGDRRAWLCVLVPPPWRPAAWLRTCALVTVLGVAGGAFYALHSDASPEMRADPRARGRSALPAHTPDPPLAEIQAPADAGVRRQAGLRRQTDSAREAPRQAYPVPAPDEAASLEITTVWDDDGTLAPMQVVTCGDQVLVTDDRGRAVFEPFFAGEHVVNGENGPWVSVTLDAEAHAFETLRISRGYWVTGRVTDGDGRPIEGALIRTGDIYAGDRGYVVATSRAGGAYSVEGLANYASIEASVPRGGVSPRFVIEADPGENVTLDLIVGGASAAMDGRLVDEAGVPVTDARIRASARPNESALDRSIKGHHVEPAWLARETRTGNDGTFGFLSLPLGSATITAFTATHVPQTLDVEVEPGGAHGIVLSLTPGCTLQGVVKDTAGEALETATVRIGTAPVEVRSESTAPDGSFRFATIPPGSYDVSVLFFGQPTWSEVVELEAGEVRKLDIEVAPETHEAEGVVVDEGGQPLAGWIVSARVSGRAKHAEPTGPTDRFRIAGLPMHARSLSATAPGAGPWQHSVALMGVLPSSADVYVVVPDSALPTAALVGRIACDIDDTSFDPSQARVTLDGPTLHGTREIPVDPDGRFELDGIIPGSRLLRIELPGLCSEVQALEFAPKSRLNVGEIELSQGGQLALTVEGPGLAAGQPFTVHEIREGGAGIYLGRLDGQTVTLGPLPPGRRRIALRSDTGFAEVEVEVVEGATVPCPVHIPRGSTVALALGFGEGPEPRQGEIVSFGWSARLRGRSGQIVRTEAKRSAVSLGSTLRLPGLLPGQDYTLEIEDREGRSGTLNFRAPEAGTASLGIRLSE